MNKLRGDVTVNDLLTVHTRDGNLVSILSCSFVYMRSETETLTTLQYHIQHAHLVTLFSINSGP